MLSYQQLLDIGLSPDAETLQTRLAGAAAELGFGLSSATHIRGRLSSGRAAVHAVFNTPPEFLDASRSTELGQQDPFLTAVLAGQGCHAYDEAFYLRAGAGKLWDLISAFGYRNGMAVSIHEFSHVEAFSFGVDGADPLPTNPQHRLELESHLMLIAMHANEAAKRLWTPAAHVDLNQLSVPELDALRWAADAVVMRSVQGKVLISTPGRAAPLQSAARKLGARTASQAVMRVIEGGAIEH